MPVFMKFDGVDGEFNGDDTFDFPQLTTEPTTSEGRPIGDCESTVYLTAHLLGDGEAPQLTTEPMESADISPWTVTHDNRYDPGLFPTQTIFPTETIRPTESLDDGGIIIIGGFPTETIRPQLTTEPTAPEDGTTKVYSKPLTFTATVTTPYDDPLVLVTDADPEGAIAGIV